MSWLEEKIKENYIFVSVLKKSENKEIIRLRHKKLEKDIIMRKFKGYDEVYKILSENYIENIPEVLSVSQDNDTCIVLEEFINGMTVSEILETSLYDEKNAKIVIKSVCNALRFLHSLNIVHRDIKPENIMIDSNGKVYLIDFDASRIYKAFKSDDTRIIGTTGYAAPEQFGINQTDCRTDIFAIGILLNVMLTGEHPSKKLYQGSLKKIIEKCTEVSPEERFQCIEELIIKL